MKMEMRIGKGDLAPFRCIFAKIEIPLSLSFLVDLGGSLSHTQTEAATKLGVVVCSAPPLS